MNFIWQFLDSKMDQPLVYGNFSDSWFHYLSLIITTLFLLYFFKSFKNADEKKLKRILLITSIVMITLEIYKQIIFTYHAGEYQWYAFPFQFCSTPMYLYLIYGLSKNKKLDDYLISFLATYAAFAGLAVMLYPTTVFVDTIGINIQTMVHHGLMVAIGFPLLLRKVKFNFVTLFKGMVVFSILCAVAYLLNTLFSVFIHDGVFNMFFISPEFGTEIPILSLIQPVVPHFVFLIVYILGFSLMALIMMMIGQIIKIYAMKQEKEKNIFLGIFNHNAI